MDEPEAPDPGDEYFYGSDVDTRIKWLQDVTEDPDWLIDNTDDDHDAEELRAELAELAQLKVDAESKMAVPWQSATFVNHDYREEYTKEQAERRGFDPDEWPMHYVDWEAAADNLMDSDYVEVHFYGTRFWFG